MTTAPHAFDTDLVETLEELKAAEPVTRALKAVETQLDEAIEAQKRLVLIEAPSYHEMERAKVYAEMLKDAGLTDVRVDDCANVWGYIRGTGNTGQSVVLEGHLDTVFAFGSAKAIHVDDDGRIHCPGICDDTRALAANLNVLWALMREGVKPVHDIVIAGTVCEEGLGGMKGMKALLESLDKETHVLATVSIDGPTATDFYANATGMVDWEVEMRGPGGHAWLKPGTPSAVQAACRAAVLAADLELPDDPKTSLTVSLIEGGQAIHGIAERAVFKMNARSNSQAVLDDLNDRFITACQQGADEENARWNRPGVITMTAKKILDIPAGCQPDDARIIQAAKLVTQAVGVEPKFCRGGCTNSNMSIARGIPAVTLGRGGDEYGTHTLAEWFDPKGVWRCEQKSILLLLLLAGLDGVTQPLGETL